jgi:hypothetical protein
MRPAIRDRRRDALVFAMYHPAAALRTPAIERESYDDIAQVPTALIASRERRGAASARAWPRRRRPSAAVACTRPEPEPRRRFEPPPT